MILFLYFIKRNIDQIGAARKEEAVKLPKKINRQCRTVYITSFLMGKYLTKGIVGMYIFLIMHLYY